MSIADRWQAYAKAFEESLEDDDWSRIEPYFTEDAVYDGGQNVASGRDAVLAQLKGGVDAFDRNMDRRTPEFSTPRAEGDTVRVTWKVTYTKDGARDLVISGTEVAKFSGDRIQHLADVFDPEATTNMQKWMAEHGGLLQAG
jgi:hypothetical protein